MSIEAAALGAGKSVAEIAARRWLTARAARATAGADLIDLIKVGFSDEIMQRKAQSKFDDLISSVAEHLRPYIRGELRGLEDSDREAALFAVAETLNQADLSDEALFADDVDPVRLAKRLRAELPPRDAERELGEAGARLYDVALSACCDCLAHIVKHLPEFAERAAAESLAKLTRVIADLDEVLARLPMRTLDAPQGDSFDDDFTRRYLEKVSVELDRLELFGVRFERFTRPRTTLSVAYISLNVTDDTPKKENRGLKREPALFSERHERQVMSVVRVEHALSAYRLMLIRGEAGGGKSTLLRWLAVTAARNGFTGDLASLNGCVPFLIKLRSYAGRPLPRSDEFIDDVARSLGAIMPDAWVHRCLQSGRAILLVDGVDEIIEAQREKVRDWLRDLTSTYQSIQVVATSRPAAAEADWLQREGFRSAFLEPLAPDDLTELIRHWHSAIQDGGDLPCAPEDIPLYESRLLAQLDSAPHLRALATTPLLAAMLCALNLDRDTLPRNRMGLYADVIDMLLETRDAKRGIPSASTIRLERDQKRRLLHDLAWHLTTNDLVEIPRSTAQRLLGERVKSIPEVKAKGEEVLSVLLQRSGIIREPIPGQIDFIHRTLQEYLAAERAADLDAINLLVRNAHVDRWRETIVMAAGRTNETQRRDLIEGILGRAVGTRKFERQLKLLAVRCLETLPPGPDDLKDALEQCLEELIPPCGTNEANSLAALGEPVLRRLPLSLDGLSDAEAEATIRTAWLVNGDESLGVLRRYAADPAPLAQAKISAAWRYFNFNDYAERVLSTMPSGGTLAISDPAQFAALHKVAPLSVIVIIVGKLNDVGTLSAHASSLRTLMLTSSMIGPGVLSDLVTAAPRIRELYLGGCNGIGDLTPLAALKDLEILNVAEIAPAIDLSPLAGNEQLKEVCIVERQEVYGIHNLSARIRLNYGGWRKVQVSPSRHSA